MSGGVSGDVSKSGAKPLLGKWRITEMNLWDSDYIDMLEPGCIHIGLRCEYGQTSIWFTFAGTDEMDDVYGDGDAELEEDGRLTGEIRFREGDESKFKAKRWSRTRFDLSFGAADAAKAKPNLSTTAVFPASDSLALASSVESWAHVPVSA